MKNTAYAFLLALAIIIPYADHSPAHAANGTEEKSDHAQTANGASAGKLAAEIEDKLKESLELYKAGNSIKARELVSDTYFDVFEGKGLEKMIGMHSPKTKNEMESGFAKILGLMKNGMPPEEVESAIGWLSKGLINAADEISPSTGPFVLFISSIFIIAREGFEAILVISALAAYLRRTDNADKIKYVSGGAISGIFLSVLTAIAFLKLYTTSGTSKENLEGITMLVAAAVLFYVSYWLTSKAEAAKWMAYIRQQVTKSVTKGSLWALGLASFIVVYREGAETVLFYSALISNAGAGNAVPVMAGFAVGCLFLAVIYYAFKYGAERMPIGTFFNITSAILYFMSFVFAGRGVLELQISGLIHTTPVSWMPQIGFLGIYPSLESLALQSILLLAAAAALGYLFLIQPFRERGRVLNNIAHTLDDLKSLHEKVEHIRSHTLQLKDLKNSNKADEIDEISSHINEIDEYSHEVITHLENLEKDTSAIMGNLGKK